MDEPLSPTPKPIFLEIDQALWNDKLHSHSTVVSFVPQDENVPCALEKHTYLFKFYMIQSLQEEMKTQ